MTRNFVRAASAKYWPLGLLFGLWWLSHAVRDFPSGYLTPFDSEIWVAQGFDWLVLAAKASTVFLLVVSFLGLIERASPMKRDRRAMTAASPGERPRRESIVLHAGALAIAFSPLVACLSAGCAHASIWLDEVTYWYFEKSWQVRAEEWHRPGSRIAPFFTNFFYCDIQRAVHAVVSIFGLTLRSDPELYLRCFSIFSFVAAVVLLYVWTFLISRSVLWAMAGTAVFSASPLFLFYAFEARVYAFATLAVLVDLILLSVAMRRPRDKRLLTAGALSGAFLVHLHAWVICLFMGIFVAGAIRVFYSRNAREATVFGWFTIPAGIVGAAETAAIMMTQPHVGYPFPLFLPKSFSYLLGNTLAGLFSGWGFPRPLGDVPLLLLGVASALLAWEYRRELQVTVAVGAVVGLALSVEIGGRMGFLVSPRYQVPLYGAVLFALVAVRNRGARLAVGIVAIFELAWVLPASVPDILGKGNGRDIAAEIARATPRDRTAVVVQHGLHLGYPDPLNIFPVQFYLDNIHASAPPYRMFELPDLNETTGSMGLGRYFGGGPPLKSHYASTPLGDWQRWLEARPFDRIWFVAVEPTIGLERTQSERFAAAIEASGFAEDRRGGGTYGGYPPTRVRLFRRPTRG